MSNGIPTTSLAPRFAEPASDAAPVSISTSVSESEWDAFVLAHPDASGYHRWRWRFVFERAFGHEAMYPVARRGAEVVGVLPLVVFRTWLFGRFAVSLPFVNYGGVVANDTLAASALLRHATEVAREQGLAHVELRHRSRMFEALPAREHKVAMILPLEPSAERIWTGLDRKVRNQVRKAEKSGLVVESGGRELLPAFYRVFAENMRDLGTPVYSRRLFDEVFAQYPESARVFCVQRDSRTTIAAGIAYRHRDGVEVPWASSLSRYRALCPNNLLYWRVIEWAVGLGLRFLDFGRSTPDGGTYHFKRQWGAVPHPLAWEYALVSRTTVPDQGPTNPRFDRAIAVWKRLPVWASTALGPPIVRSIP